MECEKINPKIKGYEIKNKPQNRPKKKKILKSQNKMIDLKHVCS